MTEHNARARAAKPAGTTAPADSHPAVVPQFPVADSPPTVTVPAPAVDDQYTKSLADCWREGKDVAACTLKVEGEMAAATARADTLNATKAKELRARAADEAKKASEAALAANKRLESVAECFVKINAGRDRDACVIAAAGDLELPTLIAPEPTSAGAPGQKPQPAAGRGGTLP